MSDHYKPPKKWVFQKVGRFATENYNLKSQNFSKIILETADFLG